jgi:hypothetical protein
MLRIAGTQADDTSSSDLYDVQVRIVDQRKVKLQGRKTCETVAISYESPRDHRIYSSDNPGRLSYRSSDFPCPYDREIYWYGQFLEMNRK